MDLNGNVNSEIQLALSPGVLIKLAGVIARKINVKTKARGITEVSVEQRVKKSCRVIMDKLMSLGVDYEDARGMILDYVTELLASAKQVPIRGKLLADWRFMPDAIAQIDVSTLLQEDWVNLKPIILSSVFEGVISKADRDKNEVYHTPESIVNFIVKSTISLEHVWQMSDLSNDALPEGFTTRPDNGQIQAEINSITDVKVLEHLHDTLARYTVLDPFAGTGNFPYAAYREIKNLERLLLTRMKELGMTGLYQQCGIHQIYAVDIDPVAVEICKRVMYFAYWEFGLERHPKEAKTFIDDNFRQGDTFAGGADFVPGLNFDTLPRLDDASCQ